MQYSEKCCSRCGLAAWDSDSGNRGNTCNRDGKPCDTNGAVFND